ncbi:tyrosine-protein phosphatase [Aldersonia kunmingensis]|uniref:tyrosine-protein phosphatase n=1 Tax=Aldersonia kunmingensis TaxID=408066 RepID=UPI000A655BFD|nr:tyrosine-protein phosphatase [Aldersonia kunmingensis]
MSRPTGAPIRIAGLPNLRDVGGWPTSDGGRVRRGMLYRSVELNRLDADGVNSFAALGIRTVFDLRTEHERTAQPDNLPEGTRHVVADVLADSMGAAAAHLLELLEDPAGAAKLLGDGAAAKEGLAESYRNIVGSNSALSAYRTVYTDLVDPQGHPALIHCTTGKDRTGWGAAALLMLLGVDDADVMSDYLLTNEELLPSFAPLFERFAEGGGDPAVLALILGVRQEYLETGIAEMRTRFGDIEGYFASGLGFDEATMAGLRDIFVEPA